MTWYKKTWYHDPVLLQEVLDSIPANTKTFLDGTLGHGGHSKAILEKFIQSNGIHSSQDSSLRSEWPWDGQDTSTSSVWQNNAFTLIWVDKDLQMMEKAKSRLAEFTTMKYVHGSYAELKKITDESWIPSFDYILLDIGVNMDHFKVAERGFSLKLDGPLDMRFDQTQWVSVSERLNLATYQDILELMIEETDFGESLRERIAKELSVTKRKQEFTTTGQFRDRAKSIDISDKMLAVLFQAFRILVNNELKELDTFLEWFVNYLSPWWICGIMSYHSGEDRRVKKHFKYLSDQWVWSLVNKKVIKPSWQEAQHNKAARSAKYRMFQKS